MTRTQRGLARPWILIVLALGGGAVRAQAPVETDDWPRYGHDGALTARSSLRGDIVSPRESWSLSIAGRLVTLELTPDAAGGELALAASRPDGAAAGGPEGDADDVIASRWGLAAARLDIDGSGTPRPAGESYHERWARVLPGVAGLQRIGWTDTWTTAKICRLQVHAHDQGAGQPRLVWQTDPPEGDIFTPLNIIQDIDGDGVLEVCTAAHYRVMVFEGTTGRKESELRYHSCRPYGWFGLFDVDADGQTELVTLGDFQSHLDVLAYDPKKPEAERLSVKWRRDLETDITLRAKWPQIGPRPVGNFTGDSRLEIALNLFNETGDGQWHVQVIDASTGGVLCDLPRRFIEGIADADGDGRGDLFCRAASGVVVPQFSRVEVLRVEDREARVLFSAEESGWACADLPRLEPHWATTAMDGMRHVLVTAPDGSGRPAWLIWTRTSGAAPARQLAAMRLEPDGKAAELWRLEGFPPDAEARAIGGGPAPRALAALKLPCGGSAMLKGSGVRPRIVRTEPAPGPLAPPIASRLEKSGLPVILAEGAGGQVHALEPPAGPGGGARIRWSVPGRGMTDGSRRTGVSAQDLDGDGAREVIAASEAPDGCAQLVAHRSSGEVVWRARFDGTPGPEPAWNRGGLTFWWPGHFRRGPGADVFVSVRRGFMHSDVGVLVDGKTGQEVWRQHAADRLGVFHWGYAGNVLAARDMNGDGIDELVNLYPVCFWLADGETGNLLEAADLASRKKVPAWAAYGEPMAADFTGDGRSDVLLDSGYILALLDARGETVWNGPAQPDYPTGKPEDAAAQTTQTKHALADLDGDGRPEIASAGYADGVRAIDPRDGKVRWSVPAPAPTAARVCAANLDGRGGDEVLYPAGDTLVAITGDRRAGAVLWTWKGPAQLSMPAIADTDGDGRAEIIVRSAAGTIHCIDGAQK